LTGSTRQLGPERKIIRRASCEKNKDGELIIDGKLLSEIREYMKAMATEVGDLDELPTDTTPKKVLIGIPIDAI
jgi:hypothetical protein